MATVTDTEPEHEAGARVPALLDHPQPLGILPTRRFWDDPVNKRVVKWPLAIMAAVLVLTIVLLDLPWWAAGLSAGGAMLLIQGSFERYIRHAAKRRFRSQPEPPALAQEHDDRG